MRKSALIIVDMVRDFTDPEGLVYYPENRNILKNIQVVLEAARKQDLLVIFLQHRNRRGKVDRKAAAMRPNCIEGTFGVEINPLLTVDFKVRSICEIQFNVCGIHELQYKSGNGGY